jgi:protocatechuate 3,4-dioxygenase, beta subunit
MKNELNRRTLFKGGSLVGLGLMAGGLAKAADVITPPQTEGPFYPTRDQVDKDVDLTRVEGHQQSAKGEVIIVKGLVTDKADRPLAGALIDVWQACATGRYDHELDPNTAELDPNFQYWAKLKTDEKGEYSFKTILPGAYPADGDWLRPPHIHFRVDAFGFGRLTTQMYFKGQALNDKDRILIDTERRYGRAAKDSLVVDFSGAGSDGIPVGQFNIVLGTTPNVVFIISY